HPPLPPLPPPFPYTTLFRSPPPRSSTIASPPRVGQHDTAVRSARARGRIATGPRAAAARGHPRHRVLPHGHGPQLRDDPGRPRRDRKSTRLNSSHVSISYAV